MRMESLLYGHKNLKDSNFKFRDYFTSVGIKPYKGFTNIVDILASKKDIEMI